MFSTFGLCLRTLGRGRIASVPTPSVRLYSSRSHVASHRGFCLSDGKSLELPVQRSVIGNEWLWKEEGVIAEASTDEDLPSVAEINMFDIALADSDRADEMELDSVKRKRVRKMNKHKHKKNRKKQRFLLRKLGKI